MSFYDVIFTYLLSGIQFYDVFLTYLMSGMSFYDVFLTYLMSGMSFHDVFEGGAPCSCPFPKLLPTPPKNLLAIKIITFTMILGGNPKHDSLLVLYRSVILRCVFNIFDVRNVILRCLSNIFDFKSVILRYVFIIFDAWSFILRYVFNILDVWSDIYDVFLTNLMPGVLF